MVVMSIIMITLIIFDMRVIFAVTNTSLAVIKIKPEKNNFKPVCGN